MRINAYILAADPAWIEASVLSYYDIVDRIVVSYDEESKGWTGVPIDVEQCLRRLKAIDKAGKLDYRPGHFARPEFFDWPMESETHQRQVALDQASDGADWVLQLDTDEVIGNIGVFREYLDAANQFGRNAFNYPSIWLYCRAFGGFYLESGRRCWRRMAGYPGPMAVRSRSKLLHARRGPSEHYHVDLTHICSAGAVPNGIQVDHVIAPTSAIWHFAMVRTETFLRRKLATSGHAHDRDWSSEINRWLISVRRPLWASIFSQVERGPHKRPLRLVKVPRMVESLIRDSGPGYDEAFVNVRAAFTAST